MEVQSTDQSSPGAPAHGSSGGGAVGDSRALRFRLLGSLEALDDDGRPVDLGGAQPRTVLAMLLVAHGHVVSADALIDALWGDHPPASASGTLQSYVSRLRRVLEPGRNPGRAPTVLVSDPPGYRLAIDADQVDFRAFEQLADEGRALLDAGDAAAARERLRAALALWRGPALVEFADAEFARGTVARLEERRLVAVEDRLEADLRLGRHAAVIGELTELVAAHPLREGLRAHLALALYRAGRQAEALRTLDETRRALREELGIDPSRVVRDLESRILVHDPSLDAHSPPPPARAGASPPAAPPLPAAAPAPLVGRAPELAQLVAAVDEAVAGRTRWVLLEGEPGIGKTRLLEELAVEAADRGAGVLWGRCYEGGAAPSFWPWLGVLRALVDALPADEHGESLAAALGQLVAAAGSPVRGPGADAGRFQVFEAVADALGRVAARRPVVALFDDLQWADQASLELIEFLAQRLRDPAVLLAGSLRELEMGRNDALVGAVAAVARQPGARRIHLRGLGEDDSRALIERATGVPPAPAVAAAIHRRAEGNPFFVGELARLVADAGLEDAALTSTAVPAGVRDVLRRRLGRLPEATLDLLAVAAVIGRDVEVGLLTRAAGVPVDRCLDDLEPAVVTRLLLAVPDQPSTFRFSHALVREVVLDDVSPLRRARYHQRVADAIVAVAGEGDDDTAEIVAEHLWSAVPLGLQARAADALERGADVAVRRFAYEAAADMLDRAVQLRRAAGSGRTDMEAELLAISRLAAVRRMLHGYGMGSRSVPLDRAKELANRTGRVDVVAALLWFEWAGAATACDFAVAEPLAAQLLQLARTSPNPVVRSIGYHSFGVQCWHRGRMRDARRYLDESLVEGDEEGAALLLESGTLMRSFHLHVHELLGLVDDAAERFAKMVAEQPQPLSRMIVWSFDTFGGAVAGDAARTDRAARAALDNDPEGAVEFYGGGAQMYLGWAVGALGDVDEGLALMREGRRRFLATGAHTILALHLAHEAMLLAPDRTDEAERVLRTAYEELERYGEHWHLPNVLLAEAEVRRHQGAGEDEVARLVARSRDVALDAGIVVIARRAERAAADLGLELPPSSPAPGAGR